MKQRVVYGDKLFFIGSCFAEEIGGISHGLGFDTLMNPFGVLFNPFSIASVLRRVRKGVPFSESDVVKLPNGCVTTFSHNTKYWYPDAEHLFREANAALEKAAAHFDQSKWVFVSLGTSWCYRHKKTGQIVANCHKMPGALFSRERLSVEESERLLADMVGCSPEKHFVFTVSPLRHLNDGLHENQLSKAALLLAVDKVCDKFDNASYFPAYEIMMDELRDYRYYKEDLFHPNATAVQYIWEAFAKFGLDDSVFKPMKKVLDLKSRLAHKPFYPDSETYRHFVKERDAFAAQLRHDYPSIRLENLTLHQDNDS